jgi:hypothetical protein
MKKRSADGGGGSLPYWVGPIFLTSLIVGVSILCFVLVPEETFVRSFFQTKADGQAVVLTYLYILILLVVGVVAGGAMALHGQSPAARPRAPHVDSKTIEGFGLVAFWLTVFGYAVYIHRRDEGVSGREFCPARLVREDPRHYVIYESSVLVDLVCGA